MDPSSLLRSFAEAGDLEDLLELCDPLVTPERNVGGWIVLLLFWGLI